MDVINEVLQKTTQEAQKYKPVTVNKHLDLEYDLGTLLAVDPSDLDLQELRSKKDDYLLSLTRDNTQLLLNKIWELPTNRVDEAIVVKLPPQISRLPRMKPVPKPRPLTKWQKFALEKGIQKKKKGKLSWDEQLKKWVPLYGFKKAKVEKEKNWLLEIPANANPMEDQFVKKVEARSERVAKNELQRLRNIAKAKKIKVPKVGIVNSDVSSAKELQAAVTVAKASTASLGKFQEKLPNEKEARGIASITPGATRKRKLPPVPGTVEKTENLAIIDSVLNKRPKLNFNEIVAKHVNTEQVGKSQGKNTNSTNRSRNGKKPKKGAGQRRGKIAGGRKRR